ncbi:MAG: hypothetical protein AB7M12_14525, partial [Hyphomonadaceae bacterium]
QAIIILGSTFDETMEGSMRVSVVATGIDVEAVVTQNTVVPHARRAADGYSGPTAPRAPAAEAAFTSPAAAPPAPALSESASLDAARPDFAMEDEEAERRRGFNLFGWMKGAEGQPARPPEGRPDDARRTGEARDESLDEELEIPAFLRRQMNPR